MGNSVLPTCMTIEQLKESLAAATYNDERVVYMNGLALALSRVDPREGLNYAEGAERLAIELGDLLARAESLRASALCHETLSNYTTAMEQARQGRRLYRRAKSRVGEAKCLNAMGVIAFGMTDFPTAITALETAKSMFVEEGYSAGIASAHNNLGMVHQALGAYPEALAAYLEALRISESIGDEATAAVNIGNVSNIYYYLGDFERSFEYDGRALEVARRNNDRYGIAHVLESISSNYKARDEYDNALEALNEALALFRELGEKRYEAAALIKIGSLHELRNELKQALDRYGESLSLSGTIGRDDIVVNALLHRGALNVTQGEHARAIHDLQRGLELAREKNMPRLQCELLSQLSIALHGSGRSDEAFVLMTERSVLQEQLHGEQQRRVVAEMQARFDVERAEKERDVLRMKNEHLEEMMELRSKELTAMAMRLVQKNSFLQKLRKDVIQLAREQPQSKKALEIFLREIVENLHGDDEWDRFEQEFQNVHQDYIQRIAGEYPALSPTELKICALLKVNLSNKEIGNMLAISVRSVESHRYSIRKKIQLPQGSSLSAYLAAK